MCYLIVIERNFFVFGSNFGRISYLCKNNIRNNLNFMKIVCTSDWHLGNLFHGNDRLPEHRDFLSWLLSQLKELQPDALLVAGDIFDNGNPSVASQSAYYEFLADATEVCPDMQIIITAGNHDSASRLEAPRPLLARHKVEIRGNVHRTWQQTPEGGCWINNYDDLVIPIINNAGEKAVVLAVPYLRTDVILDSSYSKGVNKFLRELTSRARELYPGYKTIMMAHMYAKGAAIAEKDASEKIVIGGQEEVEMTNWSDHPDYLTCGHIHKRQHIWNTDWARYTGSVLPMSFAEVDYKHGVDVITFDEAPQFIEYTPQHKLRVLPSDESELTPKKLAKIINEELRDRDASSALSKDFDYVLLKVKLDKVNNDTIKELEDIVNSKDAVLCKTQKIMPNIDVTTISGSASLTSIDDILNRDPLDTLKEAFAIRNNAEMSEHQASMLKDLLNEIKNETTD